LQAGAGGDENNPVFYVSGSPWNFFDLFLEFFRIHGIPQGPILLRDFGLRTLAAPGQHHGHKTAKIVPILETYPTLPFVLIGDSGEQDPEIYRDVVRAYPDRIKAIYIRSVTADPARIAAIDGLIEEVRRTGCQLVLAPDSEFAAVHAAGEGLIRTDALAAVRGEKSQDERSATAAEVADSV
jgi:phosphatidate phosphatase APP1